MTKGTKKNIIAPMDATTGDAISVEELVRSGQAVRVDTWEAIMDSDYYIKRLEEALPQVSASVPLHP